MRSTLEYQMKILKLGLTVTLDSLGIKYIHLTQLTKYIWRLSKDKIQYKIKWNIPTYASPYKWRCTYVSQKNSKPRVKI